MPETHDFPTRTVHAKDLDHTHVLVGESGGLSAVYDSSPSSAMPGLTCVETEHGPLYLDPDHGYEVYDSTGWSEEHIEFGLSNG